MSDMFPKRAAVVAGVFLGLHLMAQVMSPGVVWGVDMLRYVPDWGVGLFALLSIALFLPKARAQMLGWLAGFDRLSDWQQGMLLLAIGGALMLLFPSATHLLGDGALYVRELDSGVYDTIRRTDRAPLAFWLIRSLHQWGRDLWHSAEWTFRIYSSVSGMVYLALVLPVARAAASNRADRAVFAGFLLTGGFLPIFFGYAETYAPVLPVILLYALSSIRTLDGRGSVWIPAFFAALAAALHVSQVMLWPSLIVLVVLRFGRSWRTIWRMLDVGFVTLGAFSGILMALDISPWRVFASGGSALLPVWGASEFHQPYTLFSFLHGMDFLNVYFLTAPAALMALWFVSRRALTARGAVFLGATALFPVLFTATMNFEIGAFRDWDVQALSALPLTIWAGWAFARSVTHPHVGLLICGAAFLHTGTWVSVNARADASAMRFESLMTHGSLSKHAQSYGWETIAQHHRDVENYDGMLAAYRNALTANPENARRWALLGDMYAQLGSFEEAIAAFDEAVARNPDLHMAFLLRGNAHFHLKHHADAIADYERVIALRPQVLEAYQNLAQIYQILGDEPRARRYLNLAADLKTQAP